jgi:hypothetical protein
LVELSQKRTAMKRGVEGRKVQEEKKNGGKVEVETKKRRENRSVLVVVVLHLSASVALLSASLLAWFHG